MSLLTAVEDSELGYVLNIEEDFCTGKSPFTPYQNHADLERIGAQIFEDFCKAQDWYAVEAGVTL